MDINRNASNCLTVAKRVEKIKEHEDLSLHEEAELSVSSVFSLPTLITGYICNIAAEPNLNAKVIESLHNQS